MRIFIPILGFVIMIVMLKYRWQIKDFIGDVGFAEKIFGAGGTHTFIVILSVLIFIGSLMYYMGTIQTILINFFGPLMGR